MKTGRSIAVATVLGLWLALAPAAVSADRLAIAIDLLQDEQFDEATEILEQLLDDEPDNGEAWFRLGIAFHQAGKYDRALDAHLRVANFPEYESTGLYNAACAYALLGQTDHAFTMLTRSQEAGFLNLEHIRGDADLASIRKDPRFAELRGYEYRTIEVTGRELAYALLLPDDFDPEKAYPVMLAMPPGAQNKAAVEFGMNSFWGRQAASRGWVVVSPVAPADGWGEGGGKAELLALLGDVTDRVRPEGGRLHLVGCSVGGVSAFHLALESPGSFHSLTVIPGAPSRDDFGRLARLRDLHVTLIVGELDEPWLRGAAATMERLEELDIETNVEILPDEGHLLNSLSDGSLIDVLEKLRALRRRAGRNDT